MSTLQTTILKHPDSGTNNIQFDSSGRVGINTSPSAPLDVVGNDGIAIQSSAQTNEFLIRPSGSSADGIRFTQAGGAGDRLAINSSGHVGINNSNPRGLIHVGLDLASGAADAAAINIKQTSTTAATGIYLERSGERKGYAIYVGGSQDSLNFQVNNAGTKSDTLTLTRDARVGVGTPSPLSHFHTSTNTSDAVGIMMENRADAGTDDKIGVAFAMRRGGGHQFTGTRIRAVKENAWTGTPTTINSQYRFTVIREESPQERLRIESGGTLRTFMTGTSGRFHLASNQAAGTTILLNCVHSRTGIDAGGTASLRIYTDGDVENTNNSYTVLSDEKLKENIVDANSQWDDIKALRVRNFNFKEETGIPTHTQIGVIAQEVELVSPGLVKVRPATTEEGEDLEETVKSVNSSVLYMKAVKALQEAMDRIEQLEAKVAALEAG